MTIGHKVVASGLVNGLVKKIGEGCIVITKLFLFIDRF